ncbi:hypothetical protein JMA_27110 [Jeotgalibacillus malaysiensis]|uniref:Uncharacterized protein n=1 Tax=Jeotgalibacillus malaysiensis TaxID=1508404 RepID=A0A0B5ATX6_9BACL|nr:hypothetical protein [Jeotgalibacillus malaysiensis]AJD92028.1 hypothetical protein JMA_27110 [Jeotgalibacillus malaysiensis]
MEKTLTIDGKQVPFKSNGAVPLRYNSQFNRSFFKDIMGMVGDPNAVAKGKKVEIDVMKIDFETFYSMTWVLAKTANPSITDPMTWLDGFEEFPIFEIYPELQDMIMSTLQSAKKK